MKDVTSRLILYKSYVCSILEFSSIVWSPYTLNNISKIESIQRRFCNSIYSIRSLNYHDQLRSLKLYSLKARRLRYQLIFLFKVVRGFTDLKFEDFFEYAIARDTRSHSHSIVTKHSRNNYRRYFFTVDIINHWNHMFDDEVSADTINRFRNSVNRYFDRK